MNSCGFSKHPNVDVCSKDEVLFSVIEYLVFFLYESQTG